MVGAVRFELTTSWTRTKRATSLRYAPTFGFGNQATTERDCNVKFAVESCNYPKTNQ